MLRKLLRIWSWLIDGVTDAVIGCASKLAKRQSARLICGDNFAALRDDLGNEIGQITRLQGTVTVDPPDLSEKLKTVQLDVVVPAALVLHRKLNPLAAESVPFLDAFVRHQIERVTPWKAADVYFGVSTTKMVGKPPKIAVSVHAVARRLVDDAVAAARQLHPLRLRVLLPTHEDGLVAVTIDDDGEAQRAKMRAIVQAVTAGVVALLACRLAFFPAEMASVQTQTADIESQIEDQESALTALRGGTGHFAAADLVALRAARPRVVEILEVLSSALPDDDYLASIELSNDELHISGISTKTSDLVPTLEGSGRFRDVSFAEPITRVQSGDGNKFQLSMRVVAPSSMVPR